MSVADIDSGIFQNSIRYLHNISTLPETNVPTLKSFICLKRRLMELRKSSFLPTKATKPHMHCQKCFLNLFDGPATYYVISKPTRYTFGEKVKAKQKQGLPLTRYQEKYLKRMKKFTGNILVTKCKFCHHENKTKLDKPRAKAITKISLISSPVVSTKKKKKNKKDKFCGLNQSVVASVSQNGSNMNRNHQNTQDVSKMLTPLQNNNNYERTPNLTKTFNPLKNSLHKSKDQHTPDGSKKKKKDKLCGFNQSTVASVSQNGDNISRNQTTTPDVSKMFTPSHNSDNYQRTPKATKTFKPLKSSNKNFKDSKKHNVPKTSTPLQNIHNNSKKSSKQSKKQNNSIVIDLTKSPSSKNSFNRSISEFIDLVSDESIQEAPVKRKMKKKSLPIQTSTPVQTPIHKKNSAKYLNKITEIFKSSGKKNSSSANLMHFLQGL